MISYKYDEKEKTLDFKIYIFLEQIPRKPSEEELRKILTKALNDLADMVEKGKIRLIDRDELGVI